MFRFTIRDVLWLTVVAAVGIGLLQRQSEQSAIRAENEVANVRLAQKEMDWAFLSRRLSVVLPGFQNNPHWSREELDRYREWRSKSASLKRP